MKDMLEYLVKELQDAKTVKVENVLSHLGIRGRIFDANVMQATPHITDDTKSTVYLRQAIANGLRCPICGGLLDPSKSVSYDHIEQKRKGGSGDASNVQLAHPYCNTGYKESQAAAMEPRPQR